jgi:hypothetical protein
MPPVVDAGMAEVAKDFIAPPLRPVERRDRLCRRVTEIARTMVFFIS